MAGSAFTLSSSFGSDGRSIRALKFQTSHGFSAGSVVRYVQNAAGVTGDFQLAQADSVPNAEVVGVVESVDASGNQFTVVYQGEIDTTDFVTNGGAGLSGSDVWFLDPNVSGGLTATAPVSGGQVIKPIITLVGGSTDNKGLVTNYIGTVVGGEDTVSLSSVQPVGQIIPFAGATSSIPYGWKLCDGATVDTTGYPEYYTAVGTKFGYSATLIIQHQGDTTFAAGSTAQQTISSTNVKSSILSYTQTSGGAGGTGVLVLDPDVYADTQGAGGETLGLGYYPHGLVYDTSTLQIGSTGYTVDSRTILAAKTPNLGARVVLGAHDAVGAFDGYTAGQIGGSEQSTVAAVSSGSGLTAYTSSGSVGPLRQPYMALDYIIRVLSTAKASLVGGFNVADDGLTDHDTGDAQAGDVLAYTTSGGVPNYRNIKLFKNVPTTQATISDGFEQAFGIDVTNSRLGIGTPNPDYPLHISTTTTDKSFYINHGTAYGDGIALGVKTGSDTSYNAGALQFSVDESPNQTQVESNIWLAGRRLLEFKTKDALGTAGGSTGTVRVTDNAHLVCNKTANFNAGLTATGNVEVSGQIVSNIYSGAASSGTISPDFNNSNVQYFTLSSETTINYPSNVKVGGTYILALRNTAGASSPATITFAASGTNNWAWANGIKPNLVRGNSNLIVSIIAIEMTTNNLNMYCTWAEDYSA